MNPAGPLPSKGTPRRRGRYVLLVVTLLGITLVTVDARGGSLFGPARDGANEAAGPIQRAGRWLSTPFRSTWRGIRDYPRLKEQNEALREQLARATGDRIRNRNAQEQLERLREQLDIGFTGRLRTEMARIAVGPYSNFRTFSVTIDKGEDRRLKVGMPVVTSAGLVGRISSVGPSTSRVELATSPDFVVGVRLASSQELGVGHGGGEIDRFVVDKGISLDVVVNKGEAVLSSGLDSAVLPPDVPIGLVDRVTPNDAERSQQLLVRYAVDFSQLDVVQVVRWVPPR
ncbi:MAG: rod shape-determining protein MreC [Actinomycetes bacterium]